MRLYDYALAPSPRRVRIFLAEKNLQIPTVQVDIRRGQQFETDFRKLNPRCMVPILELDDGTTICESVAICRFFEAMQPEPPLMGTDAKDQGVVEMWNRRMEFDGFFAVVEALRNSHSVFEDRALPGREGISQIPALAKRGRTSIERFFGALDKHLTESEYIAGSRFSIADITALVAVDFAARVKMNLPEGLKAAQRWYAQASRRPSAAA